MLPLPPDEPLIEPLEPAAVLPVLPDDPLVLPAEPVEDPPVLPDVELPPVELPDPPELSRWPWT